MYKSIKIENLRAITSLEIKDLGKVNLLVGNNNSGKTTILEGLFYLIGQTNSRLPVNTNFFRGFELVGSEYWCSFFNNLDVKKEINIYGTTDTKNIKQKLAVEALISEDNSDIPNSELSLKTHNGDSKLSFNAVGLKLTFSSPELKRPKTSSITIKNGILAPEGVENSPIRGIFVSPTTRFDWRERFNAIQTRLQVPELVTSLQAIEPKISDVRLIEASKISFLAANIGLPKLIPFNLMGGGVATFLSIAMAMMDSQNGVVLIDEIENGLHHSNQHKIWKAIFNWSQKFNVQVFATTHSYECILAFKKILEQNLFNTDAKLFRIERQDERFRAVEYDKNVLEESIESNLEIR